MAGLIRQVEHQAAQIEQLAERDPLTGAANRRAWDRALPVEMDRARRAGTPLAVACWILTTSKGSTTQLVARADQVLYQAKQAGRNQVLAARAHRAPAGAPGPGSHGAAG